MSTYWTLYDVKFGKVEYPLSYGDIKNGDLKVYVHRAMLCNKNVVEIVAVNRGGDKSTVIIPFEEFVKICRWVMELEEAKFFNKHEK